MAPTTAKPAARSGFRYAKEGMRALREERGYSLGDLALRTGLPTSTLSRIENGRLRSSQQRQRLVADALGSSTEEIFQPAEAPPLKTRNDEIADAYQGGMRMRDLAERYKLDRSTLGRIIDRQGVHRTRGLDPATVDTIVARYVAGASGAQVANGLRLPQSTVFFHLARRGIDRRPSNLPHKHAPAQPRPCLNCGEVFRPDGYRVARGWGKFCTMACVYAYEPGRQAKSAKAKERYEKAALEIADRCTREGLLTTRDVANELLVAEHSVSGRYIRYGLLPAEKVSVLGFRFWLIKPDDLHAFKRAWKASEGRRLEIRMKWLDADFVVSQHRGRGTLDLIAQNKSLTIVEAEDLVRAKVARRAKLYKRRRGRPPKTEMKARLLSIAHEALADPDCDPHSEYELLAYVGLVDFQRAPEDWPDEWTSASDPDSYDPRYRKNAIERVRRLIGPDIKLLQIGATKIM
jgi:transcriptional regulator with XRE-family HTH domain